MQLTLAQIAAATGGRVVGSPATIVDGFANDSRSIAVGECFVAIADQRDGHDFVATAAAAGATAALVARNDDDHDLPLVVVDDPLAALARLATVVRGDRLSGTRVVGVTGSTGKTSTKDLLASALATELRVHANRSSFNNEIGLPVTLLGARDDTEVLVCEMGARVAGNVAALCAVARPEIGVITNIGMAHAEHLGGADGTERVKGELLEALPADGLAVLNADDPVSLRLARRSKAPVATAGRAPDATVRIVAATIDGELRCSIRLRTPWGDVESRLGLRGAHQAANAALAATAALHLGVSPAGVAEGLAAARGSSWRMELAHTVDGITILNDAYNANPDSMRAALEAVRDLAVDGRRYAVLGTMRELGADSVAEHRAIGRFAAACGIDHLVVVGDDDEVGGLASGAREAGAAVEQVDDATAALEAVRLRLRAGDALLVKASRAVGLESIALALCAAGADAS